MTYTEKKASWVAKQLEVEINPHNDCVYYAEEYDTLVLVDICREYWQRLRKEKNYVRADEVREVFENIEL